MRRMRLIKSFAAIAFLWTLIGFALPARAGKNGIVHFTGRTRLVNAHCEVEFTASFAMNELDESAGAEDENGVPSSYTDYAGVGFKDNNNPSTYKYTWAFSGAVPNSGWYKPPDYPQLPSTQTITKWIPFIPTLNSTPLTATLYDTAIGSFHFPTIDQYYQYLLTQPVLATSAPFNAIPRCPLITIQHMEIIQVVQDENNTVPLIAGKPTMVRVYMGCTGVCPDPKKPNERVVVRGELQSMFGTKQSSNSITIEPMANQDGWKQQRTDLSKSLNFILPPSWTNAATIGLAARVTTSDGFIRVLQQTVTFNTSRTLDVAYVPISYNNHVPGSGSMLYNGQADTWRTYPAAAVYYHPAQNMQPIPAPNCLASACTGGIGERQSNALALLISLKHRYDQLPLPKPDYLFGWLPYGVFGGGISYARQWFSNTAMVLGPVAFGDEGGRYLGSRTLRHEVAHLLGYTGSPYHGRECINPGGRIEFNAIGVDNIGSKHPFLMTRDDTFDYMSYCEDSFNYYIWTSIATYKFLRAGRLHGASIQVAAQAVPAVIGSYFIAKGLVYTNNTATLDPVWTISSDTPDDQVPIGTQYCLEAQDNTGVALTSRCFDLSFQDFETGQAVPVDGYYFLLPDPSGVTRIVLKKGSVELAVRAVTANVPVVTITSPNGGESWGASETPTITWTASDSDGDPLTYNVYYNTDGINWWPLAVDLTETQLTVNAADLVGANSAQVRVTATDGFNMGSDESDAVFAVATKAPQVLIASPAANEVIPPDSPFLMQGTAFDPDDGLLDGASLVWSSDIDGTLGTGASILVSLSEGPHLITLQATDSDTNTVATSASVYVGILSPPDAAPSLNYFTTETPTLTWSRVAWATEYEVEVSKNAAFTDPPDYTVIVQADILSTTTTPLSEGTYYWRVRARNDVQTGSWSPVQTFVINL